MHPIQAPEPQVCTHIKGIQRNHTPRLNRHMYHAVSLFLRGTGHYRLGPSALPAERPLLILLPAGHDDENGFVGQVDAWAAAFSWSSLRITRDEDQHYEAHVAGRTHLLPRYKLIDAPLAARSAERFAALRTALNRGGTASEFQARAILLELIASYIEAADLGVSASAAHRALERFRALLEERSCDPVTIARLARESGLSADHLRELFLERYGVRPVEYRSGLRLARAREMLASTALTVAEVARQVGYVDPLYFSRVFRMRFGITPSDMIRRHRLVGSTTPG